jgi:FixJ family two-component response regulator
MPVILITAWGSIALAVEGVKSGAADFLTKPWSNAHLLQSVETLLHLPRARQ